MYESIHKNCDLVDTHTKLLVGLSNRERIAKFSQIDLLHPSQLGPNPDGVPALPHSGGGKAGQLGHEVDHVVAVHLEVHRCRLRRAGGLRARAERRSEVRVAVVLDPVDHQVVAVPEA